MKFLVDIGLIILFFTVYKLYDIFTAVSVTMVGAVLEFIVQTILQRKIDKLQFGLVAMVLILGGATLIFHNELYFKWKPTVVNYTLAIILFISYKIRHKSLLESMGGESFTLPEKVWQRLNTMWILFFLFLGTINIFVLFSFSTDIWVDFKLFGFLTLLILFLIGQGVYISKHTEHK